MLKYRAYYLVLIVVIGSILLLTSQPEPSAATHLTGRTMGTTYSIKFYSEQEADSQAIQNEIDNLLVLINQQMSTYDPESELSKFNKWDSTEPFKLSEDTLFVLREALRLGVMSNGILDVTVGPLVNLWGFGPEARPESVPEQKAIDNVKAKTGLDKLQLLDDAVIKTEQSLYVDLSTIAKGYAVDKVAELLQSYGFSTYLVEIGGEMRVAGQKPDGKGWIIAVEKPITTERAVQQLLNIGNNAIATSGDYRNYYEKDGVRYSHLIDPRTGYPISHNLVAVTVVHPSSMTADGLATALNVMGKDEALLVAKENNLDVLLITREMGEFKEYTSGNFSRYIQTNQ